MSERSVLLQQVVNQRSEQPKGFRIWMDGVVERCSSENPLPGTTERLDQDRPLKWEQDRVLSHEQVEAMQNAIRESGIFDLPNRLLINYCKEDPGAAIWLVNMDGRTTQIVVYDPRPKRSAQLDTLLNTVNTVLG